MSGLSFNNDNILAKIWHNKCFGGRTDENDTTENQRKTSQLHSDYIAIDRIL